MSRFVVASLVVLFLVLAVAPVKGQPAVLFDQGHGQRFVVERTGQLDLSELAGVLRASGLEVATTEEPLTRGLLASVRALVISGPFEPLNPDEIAVVVDFVEQGGMLVTMLHIPNPLSNLLHRFGVVHSNGVVRERNGVLDDEPLNFAVTRLRTHPLTEGLAGFRIYGSWALLSEGAQVVAESGPDSWVDLDRSRSLGPVDAVQSFALVLAGTRGKGRFAIFGDDAMFQNRFLAGPNIDLAQNMARWMMEKPADLVARFETSERSPGQGTSTAPGLW